MKFKLHKINTAPSDAGRKNWEVSIQLAEWGSRHGAELAIGPSCRSQAELDAVVSSMIRDLKMLKFPE